MAEWVLEKEFVGRPPLGPIPFYGFKCTACGAVLSCPVNNFKYCPNCGEKIVAKQEAT